jgi:ABC-type nitrate/sulfonate/bicarbonate transport system permease component
MREPPRGLLAAGVIAALLAVAEAAVRAGVMPDAVAAPSVVAKALVKEWPTLWFHLEPTLLTAFTGFFLALAIALSAALALYRFRRAEPGAMAVAAFVDSLPMIAVAPVLTIWMGIGLPMRVTLTTILCIFPLFVSLVQGLKAVPETVDELMRLLAASPAQRFRKAAIPYALPYLFVGARVAAPLSLFGALIAEWTGAERGLGVYMINAMFSLRIVELWSAVVVASAVSAGLYLLAGLYERLAVPDRGERERSAA